MIFSTTSLPELIILEPKVFADERGFCMETYHSREFACKGIRTEFMQDNHSGSYKGVLRGRHYQVKKVQGKLLGWRQGKYLIWSSPAQEITCIWKMGRIFIIGPK
jgi:dTDP-4-dehydrorhamnose 3,5-epimerase